MGNEGAQYLFSLVEVNDPSVVHGEYVQAKIMEENDNRFFFSIMRYAFFKELLERFGKYDTEQQTKKLIALTAQGLKKGVWKTVALSIRTNFTIKSLNEFEELILKGDYNPHDFSVFVVFGWKNENFCRNAIYLIMGNITPQILETTKFKEERLPIFKVQFYEQP
ncbi:MAG: hypothetical protein HQL69_17055 [Magnetococcales bacterium]|nr:hypothetical protein [Magnetococcales bacterium]